jgi:hypothetical protein
MRCLCAPFADFLLNRGKVQTSLSAPLTTSAGCTNNPRNPIFPLLGLMWGTKFSFDFLGQRGPGFAIEM